MNGIGPVRSRPEFQQVVTDTSEGRVREEALRLESLRSPLWPARAWSAEQRALAMGGTALFAILTLLTVTTVRGAVPSSLLPALHQMALNARLFQGIMPHLAAFPIISYAVFAWASVVVLWLVYLKLIWHLRSGYLDPRLILIGAVALALIAVTIPPIYSTDVFSYAMFGRLAGVYHVDPYTTTASLAAPHDVIMPYLYWRDIPSPYGPLWTLISQGIAFDRGASALQLVMRFKVISCAAVLLDGWLVYALVKTRWPERAGFSYLAFAWNPMILTEGIVVAHNDVLILTVVLASAYLLSRVRNQIAIAGLTLSGLIKYSTAPIIGVAGLRLLLRTPWPKRGWLALRLALIGLGLAALAFAPYWSGLTGLMSTVDEPGRGINNPPLMIFRWLVSFLSGGRLEAGVGFTVVLSLTIFAVWQFVMLWRERCRTTPWTVDEELAAWALTLAAFLLLWPRIHTWYFVVPFGLALAAGPRHQRVFWFILAVTIGSYASYGW